MKTNKIQLADKIAEEITQVALAYEALCEEVDGMPTLAQEARFNDLIEQDRRLCEALREARSSNSASHAAALIAQNID